MSGPLGTEQLLKVLLGRPTFSQSFRLTRKQIVYLINYSRIFSTGQKQEIKGFLNTVTLLPALHEHEPKDCGERKTVFESTEKKITAILGKGKISSLPVFKNKVQKNCS